MSTQQLTIDVFHDPRDPFTEMSSDELNAWLRAASWEPEPIARCTGCGWEVVLWDLTMTNRSSEEYRIAMHAADTGHVVEVYVDYEDAEPMMRVQP